MKKTDIILLTGMLGSILFTNFADFGKTLYSIENEVLRMHILANSDTDADQNLKLCVRDRLIEKSDELFGGCETLEEMKACADRKKNEINEIALDVIHEKGYNYDVNTEVVSMEFDNREYGDMTMPAGTYDALRVTIGAAQGKNWWCVMYPPLCLPAVQEVKTDKAVAKDYFNEKQMDIMENPDKYKVEFKCVEWFSDIKKTVSSWF